jgi:hypothetical protein
MTSALLLHRGAHIRPCFFLFRSRCIRLSYSPAEGTLFSILLTLLQLGPRFRPLRLFDNRALSQSSRGLRAKYTTMLLTRALRFLALVSTCAAAVSVCDVLNARNATRFCQFLSGCWNPEDLLILVDSTTRPQTLLFSHSQTLLQTMHKAL